jgi:Mg-chelatase subunit ChlD
MIYCKKCKVPAKDTDTVCPKCKGPLSTFGSGGGSKPAAGAASPAPGPAARATPGAVARPSSGAGTGTSFAPRPSPTFSNEPMLGLGGRIQELEQAQQRNLKKSRNLALLCLVALVALLMVLYGVYARTVLAYAVLSNVRLEQDELAQNQITVKFDVDTPGKVAFDRRSGTGRTEKVDIFAKTGPGGFSWAWPSDPKTGIDYSVVYRSGLFKTSLDRHFDVTRDGIGVDIVFLMDITSSMQPFIDGLKKNCIDFADRVRKEGVDCQLGLIAFGDVEINEPTLVFAPTSDVNAFQARVAELRANGGGDPPESSIEALDEALKLPFRPHTRVCFVHITDASCHNEEKIPETAEKLKSRSIITYVVSRRELSNLYEPLCVNGGTFHAIQDAKFEDILKEVAKSIANQIKPR